MDVSGASGLEGVLGEWGGPRGRDEVAVADGHGEVVFGDQVAGSEVAEGARGHGGRVAQWRFLAIPAFGATEMRSPRWIG